MKVWTDFRLISGTNNAWNGAASKSGNINALNLIASLCFDKDCY